MLADSFFNVFKSGAGTEPHSHIKPRDGEFDLSTHKYSLVYYLDQGINNVNTQVFYNYIHLTYRLFQKKEWWLLSCN